MNGMLTLYYLLFPDPCSLRVRFVYDIHHQLLLASGGIHHACCPRFVAQVSLL